MSSDSTRAPAHALGAALVFAVFAWSDCTERLELTKLVAVAFLAIALALYSAWSRRAASRWLAGAAALAFAAYLAKPEDRKSVV